MQIFYLHGSIMGYVQYLIDVAFWDYVYVSAILN